MDTKNFTYSQIIITDHKVNHHITIILLTFIITLNSHIAWGSEDYSISNYRADNFSVYDKNRTPFVAIRTFIMDHQKKMLIVDPYTLETHIVNEENYTKSKHVSKNTPYQKARMSFTSPPYLLENYGITRAPNQKAGVFLTIDMCPSSKPFEQEFFLKLGRIKQAPIAISMTGLWAIKHPREFEWLIQQRIMRRLDITWVNHSYHHRYHAMTPINEHFLSLLKIELIDDILSLEKMLIQKGETPSVFFRFPGLISSHDTVLEVRHLGLIPIAADAWLAKGQQAKPGSIILVHGNSNEHKGIIIMTKLLENKTLLLQINKSFYNTHNNHHIRPEKTMKIQAN